MDFSEKLFWKIAAGAAGFIVAGPVGAYAASKAVSLAVSGPIALLPLGGALDIVGDFVAAGSDLVTDALVMPDLVTDHVVASGSVTDSLVTESPIADSVVADSVALDTGVPVDIQGSPMCDIHGKVLADAGLASDGDVHALMITGGPEVANVWNQVPKDGHGNDWGRGITGETPKNIHGITLG